MDLETFRKAFTGQPITTADVIVALVVLGGGVLLSWLLGRALRSALGRPGGPNEQMEKLIGRVVQWGVIAVAVAWALSILGVDVGWFSLFVLLALVIVGFSLKPLVDSFAVSVLIASRPAFSVGDEICVDDVLGEVIEITERSVVLRERDGTRVHVPNVTVLSKKVTVYSTENDRRSTVDVKLAAGTDVEHADHVIRTALDEVDAITRIGSVLATSLDTGVGLSIRFWHKPSIDAQQEATDAAIRSLQRAFEDAGILAAPAVEVQIMRSALTLDRAPDGSPRKASRP
jgi:small conductance mechanosensitive channel